MDAAELEALTLEHFPAALLERVLRAVFTAHSVALEDVRAAFSPSEEANLLPYYRRAKLEGYLRDAASRTDIDAKVLKSPGSGWFHTELRNGPVVLTTSSVQVPCGMVDPSEFRLTLAQPNEWTLFDQPEEPLPDETPLYVLLLHSRSFWVDPAKSRRYGGLPGSAYLAFPAPGLETYVHQMNLFEMFPDVVKSFIPLEWDQEAKVRYLFNARRRASA